MQRDTTFNTNVHKIAQKSAPECSKILWSIKKIVKIVAFYTQYVILLS